MGLLDDAIREHLELKRLRGADPGAVAREEHDALGPISRGDQAEQGSDADDGFDTSPHDGEQSLERSEATPPADSVEFGQETVEINMEAELAGEEDSEHPPEARSAERPESLKGRTLNEESLEWEVPGEDDHESGHDSRAETEESGGDQVDKAIEPVEDVLEETPDFLRDTPEQERLWFEQRPPRDFDFNE
jgi:hypothetical protein